MKKKKKKEHFQFGHCSSPCALKTCPKTRVMQVLLTSYCCFSGHYSFKHLTCVTNDLKQNLFLFCFILEKKISSVSGLFRLFSLGFFNVSVKFTVRKQGSILHHQDRPFTNKQSSDFNRYLGRNNIYCC